MTWIQVRSGRRVDLLDPLPNQIEIEDIAYALSMQCRWNGHTNIFYSVAQHSVLCSMYVSAEFALAALMHDAAEAYIGDLTRPLKRLHGLAAFEGIEDTFMEVIADKFNFQFPLQPEVKKVDDDLLETEWHELMGGTDRITPTGHFYPIAFMSWSPTTAYRLFMSRFTALTKFNPPAVERPEPTNSQEALWQERYQNLTAEERIFIDNPRMYEL